MKSGSKILQSPSEKNGGLVANEKITVGTLLMCPRLHLMGEDEDLDGIEFPSENLIVVVRSRVFVGGRGDLNELSICRKRIGAEV